MDTISIQVPDLSAIRDYLLVIIEIGTSIGVIYKWIISPLKKLNEKVDQQNKKIDSQEEDIADVLCDRLQQAHDYYCNVQKWCSAVEKERIVGMYTRYRSKGRNHLADHNEQDILDLPEHPPKTMG